MDGIVEICDDIYIFSPFSSFYSNDAFRLLNFRIFVLWYSLDSLLSLFLSSYSFRTYPLIRKALTTLLLINKYLMEYFLILFSSLCEVLFNFLITLLNLRHRYSWRSFYQSLFFLYGKNEMCLEVALLCFVTKILCLLMVSETGVFGSHESMNNIQSLLRDQYPSAFKDLSLLGVMVDNHGRWNLFSLLFSSFIAFHAVAFDLFRFFHFRFSVVCEVRNYRAVCLVPFAFQSFICHLQSVWHQTMLDFLVFNLIMSCIRMLSHSLYSPKEFLWYTTVPSKVLTVGMILWIEKHCGITIIHSLICTCGSEKWSIFESNINCGIRIKFKDSQMIRFMFVHVIFIVLSSEFSYLSSLLLVMQSFIDCLFFFRSSSKLFRLLPEQIYLLHSLMLGVKEAWSSAQFLITRIPMDSVCVMCMFSQMCSCFSFHRIANVFKFFICLVVFDQIRFIWLHDCVE